MIEWLIDIDWCWLDCVFEWCWLIDWLINCLIGWLVDWLIDWLIVVDWVVCLIVVWWIDVARIVCLLVWLLVAWLLIIRLFDWLFVCDAIMTGRGRKGSSEDSIQNENPTCLRLGTTVRKNHRLPRNSRGWFVSHSCVICSMYARTYFVLCICSMSARIYLIFRAISIFTCVYTYIIYIYMYI